MLSLAMAVTPQAGTLSAAASQSGQIEVPALTHPIRAAVATREVALSFRFSFIVSVASYSTAFCAAAARPGENAGDTSAGANDQIAVRLLSGVISSPLDRARPARGTSPEASLRARIHHRRAGKLHLEPGALGFEGGCGRRGPDAVA